MRNSPRVINPAYQSVNASSYTAKSSLRPIIVVRPAQ